MDKINGDLIYIILGVIFVLAQLLRKRKVIQEKVPQAVPEVPREEKEEDPGEFWKKFLGVPDEADLRPEPVVEKVPPSDTKPDSFRRIDPGLNVPVRPDSSLTDNKQAAYAMSQEEVKTPDPEHEESPFDLRSAVIYSVILERKYV
ncbi:MAG: hypothetical protein A2X22_00145 [Bacteroidetes bacterium GWF2_49_14]|nr:MAG: hypothetical protein A2X22_00145 [Bacteroidetes bacterium GWF2_49_14]HBB92655.1 hypothetical protein [Bacteroidales bacterium]